MALKPKTNRKQLLAEGDSKRRKMRAQRKSKEEAENRKEKERLGSVYRELSQKRTPKKRLRKP